MPHAGMTARNAIGRDRPGSAPLPDGMPVNCARATPQPRASTIASHGENRDGTRRHVMKTSRKNADSVHLPARFIPAPGPARPPGLRCPHGGLLASSIDIRSGLIRRRPRLYIQACMYNAPTGAAGACASLAVSPPDDGVVRREIALSAAGLLARCPVRGRAGPRIGRACRCERRAGRRTAARRPRRVDRLRALRHAAPARSHRAG